MLQSKLATVLGATLRHAIASHLPVVVVTTEPFADVARRHVAARDVVVLPEAGTSQALAMGMGFSIAPAVAPIAPIPGGPRSTSGSTSGWPAAGAGSAGGASATGASTSSPSYG